MHRCGILQRKQRGRQLQNSNIMVSNILILYRPAAHFMQPSAPAAELSPPTSTSPDCVHPPPSRPSSQWPQAAVSRGQGVSTPRGFPWMRSNADWQRQIFASESLICAWVFVAGKYYLMQTCADKNQHREEFIGVQGIFN